MIVNELKILFYAKGYINGTCVLVSFMQTTLNHKSVGIRYPHYLTQKKSEQVETNFVRLQLVVLIHIMLL